ncbi:MAG: 50S ribosomal protein L19 [Candidatus Omnitrophota bacterium]
MEKIKQEVSKFNVGDTVLVYVKIKEEGKTRLQGFEGVVIRRKGSGSGATFTVRRVSYGEGVERTFTLRSPFIEKVEVKKKGAVRRAKLYYLRKRKGKKSKVEERIESQTPSPKADALPRTEGA